VRAALAAGFLTFTSFAAAGDYYVDARLGDDTNGNGSPQAPWRTLTRALLSAQPPSSPNEGSCSLYVAPGLYDPALGERFPLRVPAGLSIVGAGRDLTTIAGISDVRRGPMPLPEVLLEYSASAWTPTAVYEPSTVLSGLGLTKARVAVAVRGVARVSPRPRLRSLRFRSNNLGVQMLRSAPEVVDCEMMENQNGVDLGWTEPDLAPPVIVSCLFDKNVNGINAPNAQVAVIERCLFRRNQVGVMIGAVGQIIVRPILRGDVFAENVIGIWSSGVIGGTAHAVVTHCTFADNSIGFLNSSATTLGVSIPRIANTILWKNQQSDLDGVTQDSIEWSIFETARNANPMPVAGQRNTLTADPMFRDRERGDYHLLPQSPALDGGTFDAFEIPKLDWDGEARVTGTPDLGADERNGFLTSEGSSMPGSSILLRLHSPRDRSVPCVLALSLCPAPGIAVDRRTIPLFPDPLFYRSLTAGIFFDRPIQLMTEAGRSEQNLALPRGTALQGVTVYAAFITLGPSAPSYIRSISNALEIRTGAR
jgi:hypothetical protein